MIPNNNNNYQQITMNQKFNKSQQMNQIQPPVQIPFGKHQQQCGGTTFIIYNYYQTVKIIGNGSFGIVAQAIDKRTNTNVAIKKVKHAFRDLVDSKRVLREIKLLMFLQHPNIIGLVDIIKPDSMEFDDVYLVFEFMQSDLEKVINSEQKLFDKHIKFFLTQILLGIYYLHSADVIHRDLKPSNLFVNSNCQLRVGDLNLARKFEDINYITEYVVTRWYRAPEILLSQAEYTKAIDVWSIGCIFAELMTKTPLFQGKHYINQIECIVAILGTPKDGDFNYQVQEKSQSFIKSLPKRDPIPFKDLFPNANPLAIDLLSKMLIYNPKKRYTIEQCLNHEYINVDPKKKQVCKEQFDWSFDNIPLEKKQIQKVMYEASLKFYKEEDHPAPTEEELKQEKEKQEKIQQQYKQMQEQQMKFMNPQLSNNSMKFLNNKMIPNQMMNQQMKQQMENSQQQYQQPQIMTTQDLRTQNQKQFLMKNALQNKFAKKQENVSFKQQIQQMRSQQQQQKEKSKENTNIQEEEKNDNKKNNDQQSDTTTINNHCNKPNKEEDKNSSGNKKDSEIQQEIIINSNNNQNNNDLQQQETPTLNPKLAQSQQDTLQKQLELSKFQLEKQGLLPVEKHISFSDKVLGAQNTPLSNKLEKSEKTEEKSNFHQLQQISLKRNFSFADQQPQEEEEKQKIQKANNENNQSSVEKQNEQNIQNSVQKQENNKQDKQEKNDNQNSDKESKKDEEKLNKN